MERGYRRREPAHVHSPGGRMRNPYRMRKEVRRFTIPSPVNAEVQVPRVLLECGHVIRGRIGNRGKAELIAELATSKGPLPNTGNCDCTDPEHAASGKNYLFFGLIFGQETEMGYFSLVELEQIRGTGIARGLGIERDLHWTPRTLSECRKERGQS